MAYCSVDDVLHEFTPTLRKNIERDYGENLQTVLERHIQKANAFVNASLARSYSVPLKRATNIVISAECKIAAYFAAIAYSEKDEVVKDKYETGNMILDFLVEADKPSLVDDEPNDDDLNPAGVLYGSREQMFSDEDLTQW